MKHVQEVYGYNDREMILLMEMLIPKQIAVWMIKIGLSNIEEVFTVFFQLHELGVHTEQDLKLALLHTSCIGSHDLKNVVGGGKSKEASSTAEAEVEVTVTGKDELQRFPEFSFTIYCGFGDICINDVLKFDQVNIYNNMSSKGKMGKACKRTIVGRVVYKSEVGEATPSHNGIDLLSTFSRSNAERIIGLEVYWSRGVRPVHTHKFFVIGEHSLELLKPVRQRWGNEQNRVREMEKKLQKKLVSVGSKWRTGVDIQKFCKKSDPWALSRRNLENRTKFV